MPYHCPPPCCSSFPGVTLFCPNWWGPALNPHAGLGKGAGCPHTSPLKHSQPRIRVLVPPPGFFQRHKPSPPTPSPQPGPPWRCEAAAPGLTGGEEEKEASGDLGEGQDPAGPELRLKTTEALKIKKKKTSKTTFLEPRRLLFLGPAVASPLLKIRLKGQAVCGRRAEGAKSLRRGRGFLGCFSQLILISWYSVW